MSETRPIAVTAALDTVAARLGLTISGTLDAYMAGLEATQSAAVTVASPAAETTVSPYWSHERSVQGAQRRRLRANRRRANDW